MNIKVIIHKNEDGYWAEVPSILGCVSQGDSHDEVLKNIKEAIEGCLSVEIEDVEILDNSEILELSI